MRVTPDFLDVEFDATAEGHGLVFFVHAEAPVVLKGLKRRAVVAHVVEAHGRVSCTPASARCNRTLTSTREPRRLMIQVRPSTLKPPRSELRMRANTAAAMPVRP